MTKILGIYRAGVYQYGKKKPSVVMKQCEGVIDGVRCDAQVRAWRGKKYCATCSHRRYEESRIKEAMKPYKAKR